MTKPNNMRRVAQKLLNTLPPTLSDRLRAAKRSLLNRRSASQVFSKIHSGNSWDGTESVSGPGSTMAATANIREALPGLLEEFGIKTILDVPCGDAYWIGKCLPQGVTYIGGDIVPEIIKKNKLEKADLGEFIVCDLVTDELPNADLIIVRDCFIHLPNEMIRQAFENIKKAKIKYMLTTTYQGLGENIDIELGGFRPVDLTLEPFALPKPIRSILESGEAESSGKGMGLWNVGNI